MTTCTSCGWPIPDRQGRSCSIYYGDFEFGRDREEERQADIIERLHYIERCLRHLPLDEFPESRQQLADWIAEAATALDTARQRQQELEQAARELVKESQGACGELFEYALEVRLDWSDFDGRDLKNRVDIVLRPLVAATETVRALLHGAGDTT